MASQQKKPPLTEIALANAATATGPQKEQLLRAATRKGGYPYYRGIRAAAPVILNVGIGLFKPAIPTTKDQVKAVITNTCFNAHGELDNNLNSGDGLYDYAVAHSITGAEVLVDPVSLGRAGRRSFWESYILKIDGKKYLPFIDPRFSDTQLSSPACRFIFSIAHTHIRLANPTEWGDVGFVILQFDDSRSGPRKVIPHFDDGIEFWDDKQIAKMIDDTYRLLDEVRKAA